MEFIIKRRKKEAKRTDYADMTVYTVVWVRIQRIDILSTNDISLGEKSFFDELVENPEIGKKEE